MLARSLVFPALVAAASLAGAADFSFVAFGDMPYGESATVYRRFESFIAETDRVKPALVLRVGDHCCSDKAMEGGCNMLF